MKHQLRAIAFTALLFTASFSALGQVDEVAEATGMPIAIGTAVIYGQVVIEGMPKTERRPNIFVSLLQGGSQLERRQADHRGYYFFMQTPRNGMTLLFELDGIEVGRADLTVGIGNRVRQDVGLDWKALSGFIQNKTVVISAKGYVRTADAETAFGEAMALVRQGKNADAALKFIEITNKDPKDYIALTMLATLRVDEKKYDLAETLFNQALALNADFTLARLNLGRMFVAGKNYEKAIEAFTRAVELDKTSADANHQLGEALLQIKKGSLAVGFLNRALELAPVAKAEIHLRLATLYNAAGLKDRASAEYKTFLIRVPTHPDKAKFEQYIKENPIK